MTRLTLLLTLLLAVTAIAHAEDPAPADSLRPEHRDAIATISPRRLRDAVAFLADEARGGRAPGSVGHREAQLYIAQQLKAAGLEPLGRDGDFLSPYPGITDPDRFMRQADGTVVPHRNDTACNVIARLRGSDPALAGEHLVFVAHYDHVGVTPEGKAFPGAFDNASSVAAGLEIARALAQNAAPPRRSIVFLFSDEEEYGLRGAEEWLQHPTVPRESIVLGISADPLGRAVVPDYGPIVVSGLERSPDLLEFWRTTRGFTARDVVFIHRNVIPRFSSDQDRFHAHGIPALWLVNPGFTHYHKVSDLPETLDYGLLADSARYAAACLVHAGNTDRRFAYVGVPKIDAQSGIDARPLLVGLAQSKELTASEQETARKMMAVMDRMTTAGRIDVIENPRMFFNRTVMFLFQLSYVHAGNGPPPFPPHPLEGVWQGADDVNRGHRLELRPDGTGAWRIITAESPDQEIRWQVEDARAPMQVTFSGFAAGPWAGKRLQGPAEVDIDGTLLLTVDPDGAPLPTMPWKARATRWRRP